jgi:hypothetical protein
VIEKFPLGKPVAEVDGADGRVAAGQIAARLCVPTQTGGYTQGAL